MARFLLICTLLLAGFTAFAQTALQGKVTDDKTNEPVAFANVVLKRNGQIKTGAQTDFDGVYVMTGIDPGTYDVEISAVGLSTNQITGVVVQGNKNNKLNVSMKSGIDLNEFVKTEYRVPIINLDGGSQGNTITSEQIKNLPTRDVAGLVATTAGVGQADEGKGLSFRGGREDGNEIWIDGVRTRGSGLPPAQDIDQLEVITGGLPAPIGDVSGGAISITTKSGAAAFTGGVEAETSQFLDAFGYNLFAANLAGPIVKSKGEPVVSFRVSGQYRTRKEADPSALGITKIKEAELTQLQANPMQFVGVRDDGGVKTPIFRNRSLDLTEGQLERVPVRPNSNDTRLDINGKIDFKVAKGVDFTLGGSYSDNKARTASNSRMLLAYDHNGTDNTTSMRGWARLRHRIGGGSTGETGDGKEKKANSFIENALYTIQVNYSREDRKLGDPLHGTNLFDYGYVGKFGLGRTPTYLPGKDTVYKDQAGVDSLQVWIPTRQLGYNNQIFGGYSANTTENVNPTLANYNNQIAGLQDAYQLGLQNFPMYNGFSPSDNAGVYGGNISNVGQVYNLADKRQNNQLEAKIDASFDLLPGRDRTKRHSIQLGLLYEQREDRRWNINPRYLWESARQSVNKQFSVLNTAAGAVRTTVITTTSQQTGAHTDTVNVYTATGSGQTNFDKNLRKSLGIADSTFINTDALSPSQFRLDMFSADELLQSRASGQLRLGYYGYDYLGNPIGGKVDFNSFFTEKDANGNFTRRVGAFNPIYTAGYIQDKFTFNDIIFRVGVRVDRYDANTKVLRDQYSLYPSYSAAEFAKTFNKTLPGAIGDDFKVYASVDNVVTAYRNGQQWYTKEGTAVNDPSLIFGQSGVARPALIHGDDTKFQIQGENFDPKTTFEDYNPTLNVTPRLAFSFPISDKAGFFAHYDVLAQRPPSANIATPIDYYYFSDENGFGTVFGNPNLRPQRTIDYEVGFQQALSKSSALKVQAYYKEMRSMIQQRTIYYAYPAKYSSYDNIDFGTVKGFTFTFDRRREENLQFMISYTLQFADGTGSSATSSRSLPEGASLRSIFPLSYDERHNLIFSLDYRYGEGKKYTGPVIGGRKIFENAGINLLAKFTSGRPYTQKQFPTAGDYSSGGDQTIGTLNGARLPFNNTVNLRIDKDFKVGKNKNYVLNVYFRVQNLLNTQNVLDVYSYTGSPYNDGYLASEKGQQAIDNQANARAYQLLYNTVMLNPDFISLPRRMFVGASFGF